MIYFGIIPPFVKNGRKERKERKEKNAICNYLKGAFYQVKRNTPFSIS